MSKSDYHEFHLVMDRGMKKNLTSLDMYKDVGSLSGVIVKIFSLLIPIIMREHKWGKQRMSRYLPVCKDSDEVRDHVHVYFPMDKYRQLKLMHQDLNVYSIAQLVRGFLNLFLSMVNEFGDDVYQELTKLFMRWKEEMGKNHLTPRNFLRQLIIILRHIQGNNRLVNCYNSNYSPFWIFDNKIHYKYCQKLKP